METFNHKDVEYLVHDFTEENVYKDVEHIDSLSSNFCSEVHNCREYECNNCIFYTFDVEDEEAFTAWFKENFKTK